MESGQGAMLYSQKVQVRSASSSCRRRCYSSGLAGVIVAAAEEDRSEEQTISSRYCKSGFLRVPFSWMLLYIMKTSSCQGSCLVSKAGRK